MELRADTPHSLAMGAAASLPLSTLAKPTLLHEIGKPADVSDVDTPRGVSAKAELARLRYLLQEAHAATSLSSPDYRAHSKPAARLARKGSFRRFQEAAEATVVGDDVGGGLDQLVDDLRQGVEEQRYGAAGAGAGADADADAANADAGGSDGAALPLASPVERAQRIGLGTQPAGQQHPPPEAAPERAVPVISLALSGGGGSQPPPVEAEVSIAAEASPAHMAEGDVAEYVYDQAELRAMQRSANVSAQSTPEGTPDVTPNATPRANGTATKAAPDSASRSLSLAAGRLPPRPAPLVRVEKLDEEQLRAMHVKLRTRAFHK